MAKNNQSDRRNINRLLLNSDASQKYRLDEVMAFAEGFVRMENVVAVVSDMQRNSSHIIGGRLGFMLGIQDYNSDSTIWEEKILNLMSQSQQQEKFLAELHFYNFLRGISVQSKENYHLAASLTMNMPGGTSIDILHRMFYIYDQTGHKVSYALCLYGVKPYYFPDGSFIVNSLTGMSERIATSRAANILSKREAQILALVEAGYKSAQIADALHISIHTVSRHRQEILAKLNVNNSMEACRIARSLNLI